MTEANDYKTPTTDKIYCVYNLQSTQTEHTEIWKPIPDWPYEVSSHGRVRRVGKSSGSKVGRVLLSAMIGRPGKAYPGHALSKNSKHKTFYVHHLVASAFLGHTPDGMEIDHINGDRLDCRVENLTYKSPSRNILGSVERGHRGVNRWNAIFTEDDIREIRRRRRYGYSVKAIAEAYGASEGAIYHIVARNSWKHVA